AGGKPGVPVGDFVCRSCARPWRGGGRHGRAGDWARQRAGGNGRIAPNRQPGGGVVAKRRSPGIGGRILAAPRASARGGVSRLSSGSGFGPARHGERVALQGGGTGWLGGGGVLL